MQAEYQLRAANAEIGAARAALFPRISLTGLLGLASSSLVRPVQRRRLAGTPRPMPPTRSSGPGPAAPMCGSTEAQRDAAVATYQKAIQTAFREVSDALARQGTAGDELRAREAQTSSAADNYRLSEARYRAGIDSFLLTLDSQRTYFAAQQTLVQMRLDTASNLVDLYRTLGGDALYPADAGSARP